MSKLEFAIDLNSSPSALLKTFSNYENLPKFLPDQLKQVRILNSTNNETITEETLIFVTVVKNKIIQKTLHTKKNNSHMSKIISGPAKGTTISIRCNQTTFGTKVEISVELKLSLKAKFLQPLIKKWYKLVLTGIFYKMNSFIEKDLA